MIKEKMYGLEFDSEEEIYKFVKDFMNNLDIGMLQREFERLLQHFREVVKVKGDYVIKR
jgi:hypothetical protein